MRKKSPYYLNSNKYQVDELFQELIKCSKRNEHYYSKYEFNVHSQQENFRNCQKPLFGKDMLKDFTEFCYKNK